MKTKYSRSLICCTCLFFIFGSLIISEPARAKSFKEIVGKVGDALENARDDIRDETKRFFNRVKAEAERAKKKAKKLEKKIRRLRNEIKGELAKLGKVGKVINKTIDATEKIIESNTKVIGLNIKIINNADQIIQGKYNDLELTINSASSVLGKKIAGALSADKINNFLEKPLLDDLRIIDILMPIQGGLERLDPTGTQACLRRNTVIKATNDGKSILTGSPNTSFESLSSSASLELAAAQVVKSCLRRNSVPAKRYTSINQAEVENAKRERDEAIQKMEQDQALLYEKEKYSEALQKEYDRKEELLLKTKKFAERATQQQQANEQLSAELKEFIAQMDPNLDTSALMEGS